MARRRRRRSPKKIVLNVKGAKFFKVFLPNPTSHQLLIPPDFVKYFKKTLKEKVILQNIDGRRWNVDVKETRDGVFLKKGWQSFVDYHGLKFGEFLVFHYIGSYSFKVKIYGINALKKESFESKNIPALVKPKEEDADEEVMQPQQTLRSGEVDEVRKDAGSSENNNGPFIVTTPRVTRYFKLHIPNKFIEEHKLKLARDMILRNEKGKEWPVRISFADNGVKFLGKGLNTFQIDNNVSPNDSCKFTFRRGRLSRMINVQIIRNASNRPTYEMQADEDIEQQPTSRRNEDHLDTNLRCRSGVVDEVRKRVGSFETNSGPFIVTTPRFERYYKLHIPNKFIEEHKLKLMREMILRNEKGREWPVRIAIGVNGVKFLGKGLNTFQIDNNVGPNDSCKFTFVSGKRFRTINVQIIRNASKRCTYF